MPDYMDATATPDIPVMAAPTLPPEVVARLREVRRLQSMGNTPYATNELAKVGPTAGVAFTSKGWMPSSPMPSSFGAPRQADEPEGTPLVRDITGQPITAREDVAKNLTAGKLATTPVADLRKVFPGMQDRDLLGAMSAMQAQQQKAGEVNQALTLSTEKNVKEIQNDPTKTYAQKAQGIREEQERNKTVRNKLGQPVETKGLAQPAIDPFLERASALTYEGSEDNLPAGTASDFLARYLERHPKEAEKDFEKLREWMSREREEGTTGQKLWGRQAAGAELASGELPWMKDTARTANQEKRVQARRWYWDQMKKRGYPVEDAYYMFGKVPNWLGRVGAAVGQGSFNNLP